MLGALDGAGGAPIASPIAVSGRRLRAVGTLACGGDDGAAHETAHGRARGRSQPSTALFAAIRVGGTASLRHSLAIRMLATSFTDHLTAWATAAAAVGTVGTLTFALYQLAGERRRRRAAEGVAQAQLVSGWIGSDWMHQTATTERQRIELLNASGEPVHRAVVHLVFIQGGPRTGRQMDQEHQGRFREALLVIPPGRYYVEVPAAFHHMHRRHGVELAFTDRAGVHWLRASDGRLEEIEQAPTDYYGLSLPIDWASPESA